VLIQVKGLAAVTRYIDAEGQNQPRSERDANDV
jgi:hypothetical protein